MARNGSRLPPASVMGVRKEDGIVPMEERLVATDISRYKLVRSNWFAYNPMRLNIGSVARWQGDSVVLVSPDYVVFRCLEQSTPAALHPEYLDHFRSSSQWDAFVNEAGDGGVRVRIYYRDISRLRLIVPDVVEQKKIADCLGALDDLIAAEGRKLEALRQHKQGLMQQLFPLPIETLPRLRFPEFRDAAEWSLPTLQQLLKIRATYGIVKAGEYLASGVPMVRGGDIKDGKVSVALPLVAPEIHEQFERTRLLRNDVVIALVGYPGEAAVIPDALVGANVSRAVGVLRVAPSLNPHYLAAYLNSPSGRKSFLKSSSGSAQIVVNLSDLNVLQLPLPEIYEQERIACFVAALNAHLGAQILKLNALRRHKQGLLQQLFPSPKMK